MNDELQGLKLDFTSCLLETSKSKLEPASLLASTERTPHLAQHYAQLSAQARAHLSHGRYIEPLDFAPAAHILLTTRCGGSSIQPYASFNVAHHVGDNLQQVGANRILMFQDLGCQHLCFMEQTHSKRIGIITTKIADKASKDNMQAQTSEQANQAFVANDPLSSQVVHSPVETSDLDWEFMAIAEPVVSGLNCDGLVTAESGVALAVMTADCLPLLLCDPVARVVGAIHCGWKGLHKGIVNNAVQAMAHLGAHPANIRAVMGAAIGPQSFEVGGEVKAAFEQMDRQVAARCFIAEHDEQGKVVPDKFLLNLYRLCQGLLQEAGVKAQHISGGEFDTRMQSDIFYSYRMAKVTGRMASVVCLNA